MSPKHIACFETSNPKGISEVFLGDDGKTKTKYDVRIQERSSMAVLSLFVLFISGSWAVYHYQFEVLPAPLTADQAGETGFSEEEAMKHLKNLTVLGPHVVGSDALDDALQYVLKAAESIQKAAHREADVQVDFFHAKLGANRLASGIFKGKSSVYSDLSHVVLKISPKRASKAEANDEENSILVSAHVDTVFSAEGAGDDSSSVAVMLELARALSQKAYELKSGVIFFFNTGEEEGLDGSHSFITQHPWRSTVRIAIDLEAMGLGGKSGIFQAGPNPWSIENFASKAKYPSGQILAQDLFSSGVINSATDFQVYREVGGLSGLDFAFTDNSAVYHTKNDKLELLKPGSLQHLGENMLAFLLQAASSADIPTVKKMEADRTTEDDTAIYFDILGTYMVVFRQSLATKIYDSVIMLSLLIWTMLLKMGGLSAIVSMALACLSIILMWIFSLSSSILVAFILPLISSTPVPYVSNPSLAIGLFGAPALLGALSGQHLGYLVLQKVLPGVSSSRKGYLSPIAQTQLAKLDAERWIFKAGLLQWLVVLMIGNYYKIGSSYLALVWLVWPAFSYGSLETLEATLYPASSPKPLKTSSLAMGLYVPCLISAGAFIKFAGTLIGNLIRYDSKPGSNPEWQGSVIVAVYVAAIICLTMVYLLSIVHSSGAKTAITLATCILFGLSFAAISSGVVPPFTEDTSRAVNVVHVVDTTGSYGANQEPSSYISLSSTTPGELTPVVEQIGEGFVCGSDRVVDFVTYPVKYGCWTEDDIGEGWNESEIPTMSVQTDIKKSGGRITEIAIDTKVSQRWALAINREVIEDFTFKESSVELIPQDYKSSIDGWHIVLFAGGKNAPTRFELSLYWVQNYTQVIKVNRRKRSDPPLLLKLRTDVNRLTAKAEKVLENLPSWCTQSGKSLVPRNLAYLSSLPVNL